MRNKNKGLKAKFIDKESRKAFSTGLNISQIKWCLEWNHYGTRKKITGNSKIRAEYPRYGELEY